jgi:hypothetical protein
MPDQALTYIYVIKNLSLNIEIRQRDYQVLVEGSGHALLAHCPTHLPLGVSANALLIDEQIEPLWLNQLCIWPEYMEFCAACTGIASEMPSNTGLTVLHAWCDLRHKDIIFLKPGISLLNRLPRTCFASVDYPCFSLYGRHWEKSHFV